MRKFEWGQEVADVISGFRGVVTGACQYMTGCNQYLIQPRCKEDGDYVNSKWFDEDRLEAVSSGATVKLSGATSVGPDKPAPIK